MPHRLTDFFDANQDLRQLSLKVGQIALMQRHYQQLAPPSLLKSSRVVQLDGQTLILAADNGAVASKLRQISSDLISSFLTRGCEVTGIQIRVQVSVKEQKTAAPVRSVGQTGKKALEELADELNDSQLGNALRRLARRS